MGLNFGHKKCSPRENDSLEKIETHNWVMRSLLCMTRLCDKKVTGNMQVFEMATGLTRVSAEKHILKKKCMPETCEKRVFCWGM